MLPPASCHQAGQPGSLEATQGPRCRARWPVLYCTVLSQVQGEEARDQRSLVNTFPFNSRDHGEHREHREHGHQRQLYADLEPRDARQRNRNQNRSRLLIRKLRSR